MSQRVSILSIVATVLLLTDAAWAVSAKGAEKRSRPARFNADALQIEELVRMEDDPEYESWKKQQADEEAFREKTAWEIKKVREEWEAGQERARLQHLEERTVRRREENKHLGLQWEDYRNILKARRAKAVQQEAARRSFVAERDRQTESIDRMRMARYKKVYGIERLPAALTDLPKYRSQPESK